MANFTLTNNESLELANKTAALECGVYSLRFEDFPAHIQELLPVADDYSVYPSCANAVAIWPECYDKKYCDWYCLPCVFIYLAEGYECMNERIQKPRQGVVVYKNENE